MFAKTISKYTKTRCSIRRGLWGIANGKWQPREGRPKWALSSHKIWYLPNRGKTNSSLCWVWSLPHGAAFMGLGGLGWMKAIWPLLGLTCPLPNFLSMQLTARPYLFDNQPLSYPIGRRPQPSYMIVIYNIYLLQYLMEENIYF